MIADFSQETREAFLGCKLLVARWKKCNSLGKNATLLPFQIVQTRDEISLCLPPVCNS